jgi:FKBP-type peptidyl-prolyl cis-trans isomerase FklB
MKLRVIAILGLSLLTATSFADTQTTSTTTSAQTPDKSKSDGDAFLAVNKTKKGVVSLPDGLQYKVIIAGKGATPNASDTVVVHYAGRLINGTEFDSSYKRGQPATFQVGAVIPGWVEALKLMKVGSTWELYIPSQLAYGDQGAPPIIGPNQALIFKVKLISIQK